MTSAQTIAAPINFQENSSQNCVYVLSSNSSSPSATLNDTGGLSVTGTSRPMGLTLTGSNTGLNTISGTIAFLNTSTVQADNPILKTGTGTWVLSGSNNFTSGSTGDVYNAGAGYGNQISGGTLIVENSQALGTDSTSGKNWTHITAGTLELANNPTTGSITLDDGLIIDPRAGTTILSNGSQGINSTITLVNTTSASTTFATVNASDVLTLGNGANDLTSGNSGTVINIAGPGTVYQTQSSNYAGTWSINSGTLELGNALALGPATSAAVAFGAGSTGTLSLNGNNVTVVGLTTNPTVGTPIVQNGGTAGGVNTLTVNNPSANTFAGVLQDGPAGQLALIKSGAGSFTLSGSNSYSGGTTINSGSLLVTNTTGSATGSGAVAVNVGAIFGGTGFVTGPVNLNANGILSPGVSGVGTLSVGSLNLNSGAKISYDISSTSVLDQTMVTSNGGLTINGGIFTLNGGLTAFTTPGTYNLIGYSGSIGGSGVSALTLNSANENTVADTYTFGAAGGFVTLTVASTGGTLAYWNHAVTAGAASGNWSTGPWTGGVTPNADAVFAGFGGGGASITSPTTVTVDGAYTVGTLAFNSTAAGYTLAAGAGANLNLSNGTNVPAITDTAGTHTVAAPLTLNSFGAAITVVNAADTLTLSGAISPGSGSGSLSIAGNGTVALLASNSYTGTTYLNGGVTQINSDNSLGAVTAPAVFAGGSLQLQSSIVSTRTYQTDGDAAASANVIINTNGNTLNLSGGTITPLAAGTGGLTVNGTGTVILAATNAYTGPTTVNSGTISISANTSLGDAPTGAGVNINGGTLISTATLTLDNGSQSSTRGIAIGSAGATINPATGTTLTIDGAITGSGPLVISGAGTITIQNPTSGQNTYTGGTIINSGTILTGDVNSQAAGLGAGAVTFNGSSATLNLRYSASTGTTYGTFANAMVVNSGASGTLIATPRGDVSGTVTGSGTLTIQTGYVRSQFDDNFTGFTGQLNIIGTTGGSAAGGDFRMDNTIGFPNNPVNIAAGADLYDVVNFAAPGGTMPIGALSGTGELSGDGAAAGRTLTWSVGGLNTNSSFGGTIADNLGPAAIIKVGTGTWTLSGTSSYSGSTNVSAGVLALASGSALPMAPTLTPTVGTALTIGTGAALVATNVANTPFPVVIGSLANTGTLNLNNNLLVINGTTTTFATVNSQVATGFNNGKWNGSGGAINSGSAAADTAHLSALGVIVNDDGTGASNPLYTSLDGDAALTDGNILVKYTYYGDTNLSGSVDGGDYSRIDSAFLNNQNSANTRLTGWFNGDFNYDGVINGSDYTLMDNAFNSQGATLEATIASPSASVTAEIAPGVSSVPEPAALGLIGMGAVGLLGRRSRRLRGGC